MKLCFYFYIKKLLNVIMFHFYPCRYTSQMAELFTEVFNWLPLSHLIDNKVLVSQSLILN